MTTKDTVKNVIPYIKKDLELAIELADAAGEASKDAVKVIDTNADLAKSLLLKCRLPLISIRDKTNNISTFITTFNPEHKGIVLPSFQQKLSNLDLKIKNQINTIDSIVSAIDNKQDVSTHLLKQLQDNSDEIIDFIKSTDNTFNNEIEPELKKVIDEITDLSNNNDQLINNIKIQLPIIKSLVKNSYDFLITIIEDIEIVKNKLPEMSNELHEFSTKLENLNQDEKIDMMLDIIRGDSKEKSAFIASPIAIDRNRLFPIPNYGSAMSPFFTTLALWVGALLLLSLLSTHVHGYNSVHQYFGRYLTFLTIGVFQALIVSLGDLFILRTYVAHPFEFVMFSIYTSIVFMSILYTLVSVFDNIGKGLGVILLVLQISSSGGTFPVEVIPPFFQNINPFLPFTHAIGGMREIVGGIIYPIFMNKCFILLLYLIGSIIFGLLFKKKINSFTENIISKLKEPDLFH